MRELEASLAAAWILDLRLPKGTRCLNIGSSTAHFRELEQPHINRLLVRPIVESGLSVIHCDMKMADGVDEVGNVFDDDFHNRLRTYEAQLLLCCNLLEHLEDPARFARTCGELVSPGGYCLVTVPRSYPYHPDPIDTMFRPSPEEVTNMMPGFTMLRSEMIEAGNFWNDLCATGTPFKRLAYHLMRVVTPFYRSDKWRLFAHRTLWLARPYKQTMVLLRRDEIF
jgi:hypothetical protein